MGVPLWAVLEKVKMKNLHLGGGIGSGTLWVSLWVGGGSPWLGLLRPCVGIVGVGVLGLRGTAAHVLLNTGVVKCAGSPKEK